MRIVSKALILGVACASLAACVAPFSDFQNARIVGSGEYQLTPSYSYVQSSFDGEREKFQDEFGLQVATGLSERAELRARYHLLSIEEDQVSVLAVGPKFGLVPDRLAVYAPIGFGFGSDIEVSETFQFQPTLLATMPVATSFELTASAKAQVWLNNDADNLLAFNLGAGFGPNLARWAIRPEVGILINPGEDGSFWQYGLGFSTIVGGSR
jgi:hypothetical protein